MDLKKVINELERDPQWVMQRDALRSRVSLVDHYAAPITEALRGKWKKVDFTDEELDEMGVDPDFVALEVDFNGWILRAEFEGEIGNSSAWWREGLDDEMKAETEDREGIAWFRGRRGGAMTKAEAKRLEWILDEAVKLFVDDQIVPS
jgi:hypothetical protein